MPMYEYKCASCGHAFERYSVGKVGQEDGGACPSCGKGRAKKVFSTFSSNCCGGSPTLSPPSSHRCGGGGHFS
jgi:putative FmdB family regulatory protein